jgi:hypothetical protein
MMAGAALGAAASGGWFWLWFGAGLGLCVVAVAVRFHGGLLAWQDVFLAGSSALAMALLSSGSNPPVAAVWVAVTVPFASLALAFAPGIRLLLAVPLLIALTTQNAGIQSSSPPWNTYEIGMLLMSCYLMGCIFRMTGPQWRQRARLVALAYSGIMFVVTLNWLRNISRWLEFSTSAATLVALLLMQGLAPLRTAARRLFGTTAPQTE